MLARLYIFIGAHVDRYRVARASNYYVDVRASILTRAPIYIDGRATILLYWRAGIIIDVRANIYIYIYTRASIYTRAPIYNDIDVRASIYTRAPTYIDVRANI